MSCTLSEGWGGVVLMLPDVKKWTGGSLHCGNDFFFYMPDCFNVLGRGEERFGWGGSRRAGAWDANKAGGTVECRV